MYLGGWFGPDDLKWSWLQAMKDEGMPYESDHGCLVKFDGKWESATAGGILVFPPNIAPEFDANGTSTIYVTVSGGGGGSSYTAGGSGGSAGYFRIMP